MISPLQRAKNLQGVRQSRPLGKIYSLSLHLQFYRPDIDSRSLQNVFVKLQNVFVPIANVFMKWQNVFVQIENVFVELHSIFIWPN